jgi:hypothetical protein
MTPGEYRIEVVIPVGRSRRRAHVVARDAQGRIITTCCADLMDTAGRRRAARDLCRRLGGEPAELERLLEQRWAEALTAAEQAPPEQPDAPAGPRYHDADGYLALVRPTRDGEVTVPLATWTARIVEQTALDDGAERRMLLAIEGRLTDGTPLPRAEVPAREYPGMRWPVEVWGTHAVVHAGAGTADHLRASIQLLSRDVPTRTVYAHTGWREVGGHWVYLHAGGAVGADGPAKGVEVQLPDALSRYALPAPPAGAELARAVAASLALVRLAPDRIAFPLLSAVYRAALGGADFSLHLAGATGVYKTEKGTLAQQHYGAEMDARHLPASWSSTGNSLEAIAFAAKDALLTVDDFAPSGGAADVARLHREAERLLRAQGNAAGRQRMRADGTLRPARPPRGVILSTGEDLPRGQSLRARLLVLELAAGDVDAGRLSACQRDAAAGLYAQALSGFVRWLAPHYDAVRGGLAAERARLRDRAAGAGQHARTPGVVADLSLGLRYLLDYALAAGAVNAAERAELWERGWAALCAAGAAQAEYIGSAEPAAHFIRLLAAALASGRAHLAGADGNQPDAPAGWGWREVTVGAGQYQRTEWQPRGERIGWMEDGQLYLEPEASYAAAQALAGAQGEALAVSPRTLRRRLRERGLLASVDAEREVLAVRRTLEGKRREVLTAPRHLTSPPRGCYPPRMSTSAHHGGRRGPVVLLPRLEGSHVHEGFALELRALREGWPISEEKRRALVEEAYRLALHAAKETVRVQALRVLVLMDAVNVRRERHEQDDQHADTQEGLARLRAMLATPEGRQQIQEEVRTRLSTPSDVDATSLPESPAPAPADK